MAPLAAQTLIQDAHRSRQTGTLTTYDAPSVRQALHALRTRSAAFYPSLASIPPEQLAQPEHADTLARLTVEHAAIQFEKRCLLAYHQDRLQRLVRAFWESGNALGHLLSDANDVSLFLFSIFPVSSYFHDPLIPMLALSGSLGLAR